MDQYNPINSAGREGQGSINKSETNTGALVGAVIIIILLAVGAFYFWGARLNKASDANPPPLILGNDAVGLDAASDAGAGLPPQGTSDEAGDISADLEAMNIGQLDAQTSNSLQSFEAGTQ